MPVIGQKDKCETPQKSMPVYDTSGGGVYWAELFPQYPIYLCQLIQTRHIMLNRPKGKPPISDQKLGFWRNQPDWRAKIQTFFFPKIRHGEFPCRALRGIEFCAHLWLVLTDNTGKEVVGLGCLLRQRVWTSWSSWSSWSTDYSEVMHSIWFNLAC